MRTSSYSRGFQYAGALLSLCFLATGCSTFGGGQKLHKSAKGSIQLQEVSDWAFEASHPAIIDHMTMVKIVKGVVAEDSMSASKMPASGSKPMRVFSDEDAEFLAPLLAHGLSEAKPEQIIGFTVSSSAGSGAEPAAGTLYVQGGSVYLTLMPSRGRKVSGFMPSAAARMEKAPSYASAPGAMSMVIDYQALARSAMPAPMPLASQSKPVSASPVPAMPIAKAAAKQEASSPIRPLPVTNPASPESVPAEASNDELLSRKLDEIRQMRETNKMKETEIGMLRKEVEWMKRELRERNDEIKAMRSSRVSAHPAPKKKSAEAYRTR